MLRTKCDLCTLRSVMITLTEARRKLGRLITQARISGASVTITDRGEPVATLVPVVPPQRQPDSRN
jgi:prevent-host-death family protein